MKTWSIVLPALMIVAAQVVTARDKSSIELVLRGCVSGKDLIATEVSQPEGSPNLMTRTFRVSGKRDILNEFKRQNGRLVEVTGLVKKTALLEPGIKVGGARVLIGSSPMSTDPTRNPARDPVPRIIAIEATSVRFVEETCPATKP